MAIRFTGLRQIYIAAFAVLTCGIGSNAYAVSNGCTAWANVGPITLQPGQENGAVSVSQYPLDVGEVVRISASVREQGVKASIVNNAGLYASTTNGDDLSYQVASPGQPMGFSIENRTSTEVTFTFDCSKPD